MSELKQITRADWIAALRSGEYQQGHASMRVEWNNSYCCLGVACAVAGIDLSKFRATDLQRSTFSFLTTEQRNQLEQMIGITDQETYFKLSSMNDSGQYTFADIADYIEKLP